MLWQGYISFPNQGNSFWVRMFRLFSRSLGLEHSQVKRMPQRLKHWLVDNLDENVELTGPLKLQSIYFNNFEWESRIPYWLTLFRSISGGKTPTKIKQKQSKNLIMMTNQSGHPFIKILNIKGSCKDVPFLCGSAFSFVFVKDTFLSGISSSTRKKR